MSTTSRAATISFKKTDIANGIYMVKKWISDAEKHLRASLYPVPHETNEMDWKLALSENRERLTEHLIAFANNTNGGYLVFGISGSGELAGVNQEQVAQITSQLSNIGRDTIEPPVALDHAVVNFHEIPLLFVFIPEQSYKPVHRKGKGIEEAWIRSGGTTRKASRHEIATLMLRSKSSTWEAMRTSSLLSAQEVIDSLDIPAIGRLLEKRLPENISDIMDWLSSQNLVVQEGGGFYITNLGGIVAAKDLGQFAGLSRKRVRIIRYRGTSKIETVREDVEKKGYAVGFEGLIAYLKSILPSSEVIGQALRQTVSVYPEVALRELIANALVHQDFTITGAGPLIEIYDDRITFVSPGTLLPGKQVDRLIGTDPVSRNEMLADKFRRYRICEERGSGFPKVVSSVEFHGLPPVAFNASGTAFQVTLYAPKSFSEMSQTDRIEASYQHATLQFLSGKTLTNSTLRERFKVSDRYRSQMTNLIAEAVSAGRIKRKEGSRSSKFAEYIPHWA